MMDVVTGALNGAAAGSAVGLVPRGTANTGAQDIEMQPVRDTIDQPDVTSDISRVTSSAVEEVPSEASTGMDLGESLLAGAGAGAEDGAEAGTCAEPGVGTAIGAAAGAVIGAGAALVTNLIH